MRLLDPAGIERLIWRACLIFKSYLNSFGPFESFYVGNNWARKVYAKVESFIPPEITYFCYVEFNHARSTYSMQY